MSASRGFRRRPAFYNTRSTSIGTHARCVIMYAVFEDGARQYRVQEGDVDQVDFRDAELGSNIEFGRVLLAVNDGAAKIGQPLLSGAKVTGEVVEHPTTKLYIQKFRK